MKYILINFVLEYLIDTKNERPSEREQICSLLLKTGRLEEIPPSKLQSMVKKAKFLTIFFDLALENKDYKAALDAIFSQDFPPYERTVQFI